MKAIVIGNGPSLRKFEHLKLLKKSKFNGKIIVTDAALKYTLEEGVTPDKFKEFYVVTCEYGREIMELFNHDIIKKHAKNITAYVFTTSQDLPEMIKNMGMKLETYKESLDVATMSNAGLISWLAAWNYLNCYDIGLIGMDMSHELSYLDNFPDVMREKDVFFTIKEAYVQCPLFSYWQQTFLEYAQQNTKVRTINCSGQGSLYGEGIITMEFKEFVS